MILAGDVGGTKTHLALFDPRPPLRLFRVETFRTGAFASLEETLGAFLHDRDVPARAAAFGVAGPGYASPYVVLEDEESRTRRTTRPRERRPGDRACRQAACWSSRP